MLWTYNICPKLVFSLPRDYYFDLLPLNKNYILNIRQILARALSQIMEAYHKPTIDELTICFDFDSSMSHAIDSWIEYAFRKGVTRLELEFLPYDKQPGYGKRLCYNFPGIDKLSALHALCNNHLHHPIDCAGMCYLRDVCLTNVYVTPDILNLFLTSCPLERLSIALSKLPEEIKITDKSTKLKSLEFVYCALLYKLEVSSSTLMSLTYHGFGSVQLKHAPLLSELSISDEYCRYILRSGAQNMDCIAQLKRLVLYMNIRASCESVTYPLEFPKLRRLEQLEIRIIPHCDSCILWPIILIKAAPLLQKLVVKFGTLKRPVVNVEDESMSEDDYRTICEC